MKLKKLELCGFKTFPDPTEILFHDGITAVVGPNGCGKSNIVDAIRWVMGETSAKGLRGDSMADVIFSGSDGRKPLNMAEVTLTLTDVEGRLPEKFGTYHEVSVTRRLYRSGETEYLINRIPCRLKDITELFMDTGVGRRAYSVVEQGRIDAILAAKPEERRRLVEEAAGITKFRARREETRRKMEHVRQNLERLGDVIAEVRREMNALKRQASRARAFRDLRQKRRELERHLLVAAWLGLSERREAARARLAEAEQALVEARALAERLGAESEALRARVLEGEKRAAQEQQQVYELRNRIAQREERLGFLRREAEGLSERARAARDEAAELASRRAGLASDLEAVERELAELEAALEGRRDELEALAEEHERALERVSALDAALASARREAVDALTRLTRAGHALDHARRQEAEARRRLSESGREEVDLRQRLAEVEAESRELGAELRRAREEHRAWAERRKSLEEALSAARSRRQALSGRIEGLRRKLHADQSRLQSLEQIKARFEWYAAGVREVLCLARDSGRNGVRGVVADILNAPAEYEAALEAALGERLQYVIVEDPGRGLEAVAHLRERRAGRSSFAPLELRPAAPPVLPPRDAPGAVGRLLDLVEVARGYERFAERLLGDVFVVETLEHALRLWEQNGIQATLVTLDGASVSPQGVISGGAGGGDEAGLLRKNREIRELRRSVERARAELSALEARAADLDREVSALGGELEGAREEGHRWEIRVVQVSRDLERLGERRERLAERCEGLAFEREELADAAERFARECERLETEREALADRHRELEARVEALEDEIEGAREGARVLEARVTRLRIQDAADRQRRAGLEERLHTLCGSLEALWRRAERLEAEAARCGREREERLREIAQLGGELERLRAELERAEARAAESAAELDRLRAELAERERDEAGARRRAQACADAHTQAALAVREVEVEIAGLEDRFRERGGADLAREAEQGLPEGFDPEAAEEELRRLEERIAGFGEVNLLATEQYEERRERFEFLEAQRADLEGSLRSLAQAIQRINRESRRRFAETFEQVSRAFEALYPRLFRGGEARLVLTDPDDLLATGVDIVARPPGKRPQHIGLLSGGEKALTAVALIFSVFQIRPSPFCILDEVDAPLDEANIGRFTDLLCEFSARSQFLVITHNRSTMEAADHLYGVTMAEPGVSKVVSVRLKHEAAAEAA